MNSNNTMNDKDIMTELLTITKSGCELYMHGTIESSTANIHDTFKSALDNNIDMQKQTFTTMQSKGWYQTQPIPPQKIEQCKQKIVSM
jgi:spore coat protein CotF